MSALVLADAVGIKPGDRETRDIADIYAVTDKQLGRTRLGRSRAHGAQSEDAAGERAHRHGAVARIHGALRLVALYARSQAEGPAAPHPDSDARAVGCGRRSGEARLRARAMPRRLPARASRRSRRRAIFRISNSRRRSRGRFQNLFRRGDRGERPMRVFQFTEQPYPAVWDDHNGSLRVNLPNRRLDPKIAADLFHRYYDEWQLADELGLDIMLNEHHSTATCMSAACRHRPVGAVAHHQARAAAGARLSDREPARSVARRRGARDDRCDLTRPAGDGFRARRAAGSCRSPISIRCSSPIASGKRMISS